jgi:small subunit ribosomal protein S7e
MLQGFVLKCHVKENYGSVLKDCSKALTINLKSSKAYYRSSLALLALERVDEALDCCDRGLEVDKDNKSILAVREQTMKVKVEKERKEQERSERIRREKELKKQLNVAFQVTRMPACPMYNNKTIITGTKPNPSNKPRWSFRKPLLATL